MKDKDLEEAIKAYSDELKRHNYSYDQDSFPSMSEKTLSTETVDIIKMHFDILRLEMKRARLERFDDDTLVYPNGVPLVPELKEWPCSLYEYEEFIEKVTCSSALHEIVKWFLGNKKIDLSACWLLGEILSNKHISLKTLYHISDSILSKKVKLTRSKKWCEQIMFEGIIHHSNSDVNLRILAFNEIVDNGNVCQGDKKNAWCSLMNKLSPPHKKGLYTS